MLILSVLFAATLAQSSAPPVDASQADEGDIIVQGQRIKVDQIRGYIRSMSDVPNAGQIGKFHSAICPAVVGLPDRQGQLIAERMRRVAAAADIRVERGKCTPNVFLIAAPDKRAAIYELYRQFPAYYGSLTYRQIRNMARDPGPVSAWQVKRLVGADGESLEQPMGTDYYVSKGTGSGSRIRAGTMPNFVTSVVMVDLKAIGGLSVTQVADYAAMRAFAETSPERAARSGAPTILTILDAADNQQVPLTLTSWDLGYLKSLYATSSAYYANYQRGAMTRVLKKELANSSGHRN